MKSGWSLADDAPPVEVGEDNGESTSLVAATD